MTKKEQIEEYIKQRFIILKQDYPNFITIEKYEKAVALFQNKDEDLEEIKKEIDILIAIEIEKYKLLLEKENLQFRKDGFTLDQIRQSYNYLKQILKEKEKYISLAGGVVPYFLLNKDSNRLHSDIDTLCNIENMNSIREALQQSPYYDAEQDSISYSLAKKDYGLSLKIMDVPIGIYPYSFQNEMLTQYSYDPITHEAKERKGQVEQLSNYVRNYTSLSGTNYNTIGLEYLKKSKDISNWEKDKIDSNAISEYGYNQDLYDRIIPFEKISSKILLNTKQNSSNVSSENEKQDLVRNKVLKQNYKKTFQNNNSQQNL